MKYLNKFDLQLHHLLSLVGLIALIVYVYYYSMNKSSKGPEQMTSKRTQEMYNQVDNTNNGVQPAQPLGQNETFAPVTGMSNSSQGLAPSCSRQPVADPSELLPKDTNSQWAQLNPTGSGDLQNVNLLRSGYHMGIDTVGNSLRNANLQLRSEPANPQMNVGPWNNTTISPDTMRVPLEIGQGSQ